MVTVAQGEIWWAILPDPVGSEPGGPRPIVVVQGNPMNWSRLATVVCVPLTSTLKWASAPGNILIPARISGLPEDSVANVSQIVTLDRGCLTEKTGALPRKYLALLLAGIDTMLGR